MNRREEEMLGWHIYDDGGWSGQEDIYRGDGENARGSTRMEVAAEDRRTQARARGQ